MYETGMNKTKKKKTPIQALIELQSWQKNDLKVDLREVIPMISILMMSVAELTGKVSSIERKLSGDHIERQVSSGIWAHMNKKKRKKRKK